MNKAFAALLVSLLFCLSGFSQGPEKLLTNWADKSPIEKAYLHTDRENYIAGETVWFKAYLSSNFYPDTISTTLYVELVNESSKILDRKIIPVFWGAARGQLDIPDSLSSGNYIIRAYSATMLNQTADFVFKRSVFIYGNNNKKGTNIPAAGIIRVEFFPEGGTLVNEVANAVAFKATNENGLPVTIYGSLYNDKQQLLSFHSYHNGMGMIEFTPAINEKYYFLLEGHPLTKYYLPDATDKGIALAVVTNQRELQFEIHQSIKDPAFQAAYIIGQMQHRVIFRQELTPGKQTINGFVNTKNLNSGIIQLTVFNSDGIPLGERLCFIDNKEYVQPAELVTDTISFAAKGKNHFSLLMKDTIVGNFSVSITDPAYDILPDRDNNIFSSLLLTSDIKGYVHNPAWYFKANNDSARRAIDLVMMTNGWRRFKWDDLIKNNKTPESNYKDLSYITLTGRANLLDSKKPFAEKDLLISIYNADSTSTFQLVNTDAQGYFRIDSMFFWGTTRLLFSDSRGKKSQYIEVKMSADSLAKHFSFPLMGKFPSLINDSLVGFRKAALAMDYDVIQKASGIMLEGVTIKGKRKKTPTEEIEEKYTSGLFTGMSDQTLDLVNTIETLSQRNIFEYLQSRVPSITISNAGQFQTDYVLYYRGGATTSLTNPAPMVLYLDEMRTDAAIIANLRPSDIALVKVYSHFVGAPGNGVGGVLSIYTKKGEDLRAADVSAVYEAYYKGYSVSKEFYSPDYKVEPAQQSKADNRITLQWMPDVFISDVNPIIPLSFYNSDRTKQYKIVIEGMTTDGKMLLLEKVISPKPF